MASSHILNKFLAPNILPKLFITFPPSSASRSFSTQLVPRNCKDDVVKIDCHTSFSQDVVNIFRTDYYFLYDLCSWTPIRILHNTLNSLDASGLRSKYCVTLRRWKVRQNTKALFIRRDMSGVGDHEDVTVFVQRNCCLFDIKPRDNTLVTTESRNLGIKYESNDLGIPRVYRLMINQPAVLVIKREGRKGTEDEEDFGDYILSIDLPIKYYNTNTIKIERNNEVLKVTIPKVEAKWISEMSLVEDYPRLMRKNR